MEKNLWGDLTTVTEGIRNPKTILEEQAEILKEKLAGLVKCRVSRIGLREEWKKFYDDLNVESDFSFSFTILSDYVEKYEYEICKLSYGIKMYPLAVSFGTGIEEELRDQFVIEDDDTIVVKDEEELLKVMTEILSSNEVHQVLRGLITIAKKEKEEQDMPF